VTPITAPEPPAVEFVHPIPTPGDDAVRTYRSALILAAVAAIAACNGKSSEQVRTEATTDSLHSDSLVAIKNELLNEVMTSTQFLTDINSSLAKARALQEAEKRTLVTQSGGEVELDRVREERKVVLGKINRLVARLDSVESRLEATKTRANSLAKRDASLSKQIAQYERTLADFRTQVEQQRAEYQGIIDKQNAQIAELTQHNEQLVVERQALADTVTTLVSEKNTAYYVIGTKEELIKKGVLVEEGGRRFVVFGGRDLQPARTLDANAFTRIDRTRDSVIALPAGEYQILTRQDAKFASPFSVNGNKIAGGLKISEPDRFWETSRFLILMKS
jgi:septal ring factor EnvC (AmiA/AmiB activator)